MNSKKRQRAPWWASGVVAAMLLSSAGCQLAAQGHNVEGVRLSRQGQYDAAMQRFQKAVAADPSNADSYYNMAATTHQLGRARGDQALLTQSENLYNQCLDLNEDHTECRRGLAVLLADTGRQDRAFKLMQNWAMSNPQSSEARIELARLHQETGDTEAAELNLHEALRIDQNNSRAWAALAHLREQSGDTQQALANYERSYSLNNFQHDVAARIAALNRAQSTQTGTPVAAAGTRTVNSGAPIPRY